VKTAAFGRDPNWGRILMAAGSAFVSGAFAQVDVDRLTLSMNGVVLFAKGEPTGAEVVLDGPVCTIELDLGLGRAAASYLASDLTYDYVKINAEYTT
jgi:glutamate N-acetyltransferase/amino-acid N-acetyltransferase